MKKNHTHNGTDPHSVITLRAYQLWEIAERPENQSLEFWLQAEKELKLTQAALKKQPVAKKTSPKVQPKPAQSSRLMKHLAKGAVKNPEKTAAMARERSKSQRSRS